MKFRFVHVLGFSAFFLATTAAYFSVTGMSTLFSGAYWKVFIMISGLELAKFVTSSFLYREWNELTKAFKTYLIIGIAILMIITSAGIYGFLSSAYSVTSDKMKNIEGISQLYEKRKLAFLSNNKNIEQTISNKNNRINTLTNLRTSQESRIDTLYKKNFLRSAKVTENVIKDANLEIERYNKEIDILNGQIRINSDSILSIDTKIIQLNNNEANSELSPLKYISKLTGLNVDNVINIFIMLLIFVFDPLAVCLVIATNRILIKEKEIVKQEEIVITPPIQQPTEPLEKSKEENKINQTKETIVNKRDIILEKYLKVCKEASEDENVFQTFKSHPDYHQVLEHLPKRLGQVHLDLIRQNNPKMLDNFNVWQNDVLGSPKKEEYNGFISSPTTIQYINVASNLKNLFGSLDDFNIIEIGGGYGGQAKILNDYWNFKQYQIIDLYEATLLQQTYLNKFKIEKIKTIDSSMKDFVEQEYDLFISNYALSEVSNEDQLNYVNKVLLNCKRGYVTCNQTLYGMEQLQLKFKDTFKLSKDIEGERETNFVITW